MGKKREHDEMNGVHSSRREQVYGDAARPAKKPRKSDNGSVPHKQVYDSSVNMIKKRIRDLTRRQKRLNDLPAEVREEDERALTRARLDLLAAEEEGVRQKMIKKYHMVRFFERKKAERQVKKLRKKLLQATTTDDVDIIKSQLYIAEVDFNYTQYCPLNEVYIGLYPTGTSKGDEGAADDGAADEELQTKDKRRPPMWTEIERRMENGGLKELRNAKSINSVKKTDSQNSRSGQRKRRDRGNRSTMKDLSAGQKVAETDGQAG